jgi:hypothetical protein
MMLLFRSHFLLAPVLLIASLPLLTGEVTNDVGNCTDIAVEEVVLNCDENSVCVDGDPYAQVDLKFDLYTCAHREFTSLLRRQNPQERNNEQYFPFLIVACGAPGLKQDYSMFAAEMVQKGYTVAVPEKIIYPIPGDPNIILNGVTPVDYVRVLEYVKTTDVDAHDTFLLGHSFGGAIVMYALNELCPSMVCAPMEFPPTSTFFVDIALPEEVRGGGTFGSPAIQKGGMNAGQPDPNLFNDGKPLFMFFGDGDHNLVDSCGPACDNKLNYMYTYHHMVADKYLIVGENLDHDSIANRNVGPTSTFRNSTLPRDVQVKRVADGFDQWIQYMLAEEQCDFCQAVTIPLEMTFSNEDICMFEIAVQDEVTSGDTSGQAQGDAALKDDCCGVMAVSIATSLSTVMISFTTLLSGAFF